MLLPVTLTVVVLAASGPSASASTGTSVGRPPATGVLVATATATVDPALGYAAEDTGSMSAVTRIIGAQSAWAAGWTGTGVDVALIDTGVAPVAGLDTPGKVVIGPDLSFDGGTGAPAGIDAYGHGTFMASLIAGRDAGATASTAGCTGCLTASGYSDTGKFVGVAPDARIVDVKVGAADGATDVTQVIAGIEWVVRHAHDPGLNIRVLSLSFGTASTQPAAVDPLARAVELAWRNGIVVVAAAGNDGRSAATLADPAYDPFVIAVGGDDPRGTLTTVDDVVPKFAEHGTLSRPVDVIAPATHLLGLRVPGSYVDSLTTNTGRVGTRFQRGSGTSQATAIVAGASALLLQRYPAATPDQVKALLTATATPLPLIAGSPAIATAAAGRGMTTDQYVATVNTLNRYYSGYGIANVAAATAAPLPLGPRQTATPSTGKGTLDATRGGTYVYDGATALTGQRDVFGRAYAGPGTSWTGGIWNGSRWTGDGWNGLRWSSATWTGTSWAGTSWSGLRWSSGSWDGLRWSGAGWSGLRWSGAGWSGLRWSGSNWDGLRWSSSTWA